MSYDFRCETTMAGVQRAAVFDLSLDVDVHVQSMSDYQEQLVDRTGSGLLALGDEVTWDARHLGIRWRMTSRITEWDRPHRFVDEQVRGPFESFRHEHVFSQYRDDVVMTDVVTMSAPLGPLGLALEQLGLGKYLRHLIERRNTVIKAAAENAVG